MSSLSTCNEQYLYQPINCEIRKDKSKWLGQYHFIKLNLQKMRSTLIRTIFTNHAKLQKMKTRTIFKTDRAASTSSIFLAYCRSPRPASLRLEKGLQRRTCKTEIVPSVPEAATSSMSERQWHCWRLSIKTLGGRFPGLQLHANFLV